MVSTDRGDLYARNFFLLLLVRAFSLESLQLNWAMLRLLCDSSQYSFLLSDYKFAIRSYSKATMSEVDIPYAPPGRKCRSSG